MDTLNYKTMPGINVQWPWSQLLLSGRKTVETRKYPIPKHFIGVELAIIETPGLFGRKKGIQHARIVGTIIFSECYKYVDEASWYKDQAKHLIPIDDRLFKYIPGIPKWGWRVGSVRRLETFVPAPKRRGRIYSTTCKIPVPSHD